MANEQRRPKVTRTIIIIIASAVDVLRDERIIKVMQRVKRSLDLESIFFIIICNFSSYINHNMLVPNTSCYFIISMLVPARGLEFRIHLKKSLYCST